MTPIAEVLELARWAPSGDNTQPWRFAIEADDRVAVHGFDTRTHCVYDLDGHPSQISLGALLESIAVAATRFGLNTVVARRESPDDRPVFAVSFHAEPGLTEDPLARFIDERRVQRKPLGVRRLSTAEKRELTRGGLSATRLRSCTVWRILTYQGHSPVRVVGIEKPRTCGAFP